jgi:hypothetical protein
MNSSNFSADATALLDYGFAQSVGSSPKPK